MKGILGRKLGMTQVFTATGNLVPVTVVEVLPNVVTQVKTKETDGYEAIQLGAVDKREKLSNKPAMGHVKKAGTTPKRFLKEIRGVAVENYKLGDVIKADIFVDGEIVDVTGTSKGKGFQGVIKRYNQKRGPMSHGSQYHRGVGSLGTMLPKRVLPGKKMPGHMGVETVTIQNLQIVKVDISNNLLLIKGNVPGIKNSLLLIKSAIKKNGAVSEVEDLLIYEPVVDEVEEVLPVETETEVVEEPTTTLEQDEATTKTEETVTNNNEDTKEETKEEK